MAASSPPTSFTENESSQKDRILDLPDRIMVCADEGSLSPNVPVQQAVRCFSIMKDMLVFNICDLESSYVANEDIPGLEEKIEEKVPFHLSYACLHWARHLRQAPYSSMLKEMLSDFLYNRLLFWLEVLSLLGKVDYASSALFDALSWLESSDEELSAFLDDAQALITRFSPAISRSTPHIYISCLSLAPKTSLVASHYLQCASSLVRFEHQGKNVPSQYMRRVYYEKELSAVAFSHDGNRVACSFEDGSIKILSTESGELLVGSFANHKFGADCLTFSSDGKYLASGRDELMVWNAKTGVPISGSLTPKLIAWDEKNGKSIIIPPSVQCLSFSSDGTRLASGWMGRRVVVWDSVTGDMLFGPFEDHFDSMTCTSFSPDGDCLASGSYDGGIYLRDLREKDIGPWKLEQHERYVTSIAFSPDGLLIASASDRSVRIWNVRTRELACAPFRHSHSVKCIAFSPDGRYIASSTALKTVSVWEIASGKVCFGPFRLRDYTWHRMLSLAFSSDGKQLLSGSSDGMIIVWDMTNPSAAADQDHSSSITSVAFSTDVARAAGGFPDGTIKLWDLENGTVISEALIGHGDQVKCLAFSRDGRLLASGSTDLTIRIWNVQSGQCITGPLTGFKNNILSLDFSPDGTRVVSASADGTIRIWDTESGELVIGPLSKDGRYVASVAYSPDGSSIASAHHDIRIWDAKDGTYIRDVRTWQKNAIPSVKFTSDGTQVVFGSCSGKVHIATVPKEENGDERFTYFPVFGSEMGITRTVAISTDGMRAASGSLSGKIGVWDVETGNFLTGILIGHNEEILSLSFSPEGNRLISGAEDSTIRIWDLTETKIACAKSIYSSLDEPNDVIPGDNAIFSVWMLASDGWIRPSRKDSTELLLWVPPDLRGTLWRPRNIAVYALSGFTTKLDFTDTVHGTRWMNCFDQSRLDPSHPTSKVT